MHRFGWRLQEQVLRFAQDDKVGKITKLGMKEFGGTATLALVEQVDGFEDGVAYYFQALGA